MEYLMQKHKTTLKAGRLPREGNKEIALDSRVAKNKKAKVGDKIGNSILKNDSLDGEYTVVGLLDGENFISIMPYSITAESINSKEMSLLQKSALIFPKENKLSQVEELVNSYPRNEIHILTLKDTIEIINQRSMSILNTLDMVCIIAIVVMVISVGSSKFVQFYNRKQEFGVLNALGYTKLEIMKKTFMEILLINSLGFFIGLGFGLLLSFLISMAIFESVGAIPVVFCFKALFISLFIPLFTALFTLVPVNRMINSLDPIVMIEGI
jgi:putative ABC transport system permease protein